MCLYLRVLAATLSLPDTADWLRGACEVVGQPVLHHHPFLRHGTQLTAYRLSVPVRLRPGGGGSPVAAVAHRYTSDEFFDANNPDEMSALVDVLEASRATRRPVDCYHDFYDAMGHNAGDSLRVSLTLDAPPDVNWSAAQTRLDIMLIMAIPTYVLTLAAWVYCLWVGCGGFL